MVNSSQSTHSQYRWYHELKQLFVQSLERYRVGERNPARYYTAEQEAYLASIGMTPQELYDFAEDHTKYDGDPDFETVLLISTVRRDYLLTAQHGQLSDYKISTDELPTKDTKLGGIPWLPRLIKKAEAKLRGEMPPDIMYGCAGDRRFAQEHGIHLADFLRHVWAAAGDDQKVLKYIQDVKPTGHFTEI